MNFLQGLLMRARGELHGIRPRRDIHALWLPEPETLPDVDRQSVTTTAPAPGGPSKPGVETTDNASMGRMANDDNTRVDASTSAIQHDMPAPAAVEATVTRARVAPAEREAIGATPSATRRTGDDDVPPRPSRRNDLTPPANARVREHAPPADTHVEIHIGKLEIVAPPAVKPSTSGRSPSIPKPLSLSDYLDARRRQR